MKKLTQLLIIVAVLFGVQSVVCAQGAKQGPKVDRDAGMESDAMHNLEVARHYFKLRKAYVATLQRCEEIIAGNPTFAKMDEVLYIAGESSLRLAESKGKQASKSTPEQLREDARNYLTQLANDYPQSDFRKLAEPDLQALGGPKKTESKQSP
jgi:outer membrane protein assembly factor BamD (BamD/ComL family)